MCWLLYVIHNSRDLSTMTLKPYDDLSDYPALLRLHRRAWGSRIANETCESPRRAGSSGASPFTAPIARIHRHSPQKVERRRGIGVAHATGRKSRRWYDAARFPGSPGIRDDNIRRRKRVLTASGSSARDLAAARRREPKAGSPLRG